MQHNNTESYHCKMDPIIFSALLFIFLIVLSKHVFRNFKLYQKVSKLDGFIPNPSILFGHLWFWVIGFKLNLEGLEGEY